LAFCKTIEVESPKTFKSNLIEIKNKYYPYKHLNATFVLTGKTDGNIFSYNGNLSAVFIENTQKTIDLEISIRDSIFLSDIIKIFKIKNQIHIYNIPLNKMEIVEYSDNLIFDIPGFTVPFVDVINILSANLPSNINQYNEIDFETIEYAKSEYRQKINFNNNEVIKITIWNKEINSTFIFEYPDSNINKTFPSRIFPEFIRSGSNFNQDDFIIQFKKVSITEY
jgi:hypothetical protein